MPLFKTPFGKVALNSGGMVIDTIVDHPEGIQFEGVTYGPAGMGTPVEAAKIVLDEADIIDVNFGCPSPTVTRNDGGSALLRDPKNVSQIISKLVKHIDKPITAKIRLGYTKMDHLSIAKEIEDAVARICAEEKSSFR